MDENICFAPVIASLSQAHTLKCHTLNIPTLDMFSMHGIAYQWGGVSLNSRRAAGSTIYIL
jgi:hypothetical protein